MYSIVFAEDEKTTRENICRVIDWERYGFVICATASDGEEALQAVQRYRPEVLITDIRMPFMDGLELSKQAKKVVPSIKIIILSGFMEFGYAQDAIRIGVQDGSELPETFGLEAARISYLIAGGRELGKTLEVGAWPATGPARRCRPGPWS